MENNISKNEQILSDIRSLKLFISEIKDSSLNSDCEPSIEDKRPLLDRTISHLEDLLEVRRTLKVLNRISEE